MTKKLVELAQKLDQPAGSSHACLNSIRFFRSTELHLPKTPLLYAPGLCIMIQGRKVAYFGENKYDYDTENYLVTSVTIPFECETFAVDQKEILVLYIEIDRKLLYEVANQLKENKELPEINSTTLLQGIAPAKMDTAMISAVERLLTILQDETEANILGEAAIKEIYYRALQGCQAPMLLALINKDYKFSRVVEVIEMLHREYARNINIQELASATHMGTSTFHRAFKTITAESPLQYLKKVRLNKARELMESEGLTAYIAAENVGYESVSQFSREFKRYFGMNPATLKKQLSVTS